MEVVGVREDEAMIELLDAQDMPRMVPKTVWAAAFQELTAVIGRKITICYTEGVVQEVFSVED